MKKFFSILAALSLLACTTLFFSSCNKEVECECTTTYSGTGSEYADDVTQTVTAEDGDCSDLESTTTSSGLTATTKCKEK